jgi:hypothetical protein
MQRHGAPTAASTTKSTNPSKTFSKRMVMFPNGNTQLENLVHHAYYYMELTSLSCMQVHHQFHDEG